MSALLVTLTVDELRELVRQAVREELAPRSAPEPVYLSVAKFAEHVSLSERTVWSLVAKGLPTIGAGRGRRVDVRAAVEWMRGQREQLDDAVERDARRAARKAADR